MGWETAAFIEWDKDCQKVLAKNFPNVPIYGDIKEFRYEQDRIGTIDLICGGFPCQPFSTAGKRKGKADDRHLWPEMLRTIREVRPAWVVGENVAGLVTMDGGRVFDEICSSLEDEGYSVEAFIVPACAVGAPHRRDRVWIVANTKSLGRRNGIAPDIRAAEGEKHAFGDAVGLPASHTESERRNEGQGRAELLHQNTWEGNRRQWDEHWLSAATRLCGIYDGLPTWVDRHRTRRLKQLGNSIVPQVVYEIFRAIDAVRND